MFSNKIVAELYYICSILTLATEVIGCACCDGCAKSCKCTDCKCSSFPFV